MLQNLQTVIELISNNIHLSEEEKTKMIASIKEADKKISITEFKLDRTEKVKRTTAILLEETIEELEQKRKAVEAQNRELEVEASLERVRAIALSMKAPADMLDVCKTISHQLASLNVKEIRNVQTAIFYPAKGTYMNYEYYAKHDKTFITETSFTNHKMHRAFAEQMLKGSGEFFLTTISKSELNDWIAYQKTTNVFIDGYISTASSLNYYWFSLGEVALGISTYEPLKEEDKALFKRFLKVFELAYRRYLDIEKAETQAREAKIEAALEKVRSSSLAMHHSKELNEVVTVLFEKLKELNFLVNEGAAIILTFTENSKDHIEWIADPTQSYSMSFKIPYSHHSMSSDLINAKESGAEFFSRLYSFEEKNAYFNYLFQHTDYRHLSDDVKKVMLESEHMGFSVAFKKNSAILIPTNIGKLLTDEQKEILKRFTKVFEQSYTRFLDLQKAEAQAREAQIEVALENVRSASLAMHHSNQLKTVAAVMFKKLMELGLTLSGAFIFLFDKKTRDIQLWIATTTLSEPSEISIPFTPAISKNLIFKDLWSVIENSEQIFNRVYSGKEKNDYFRHVGKHNTFPQALKDFHQEAKSWITSIAGEKHAALGFDSWNEQLATIEDFQI